MDGKSRAPTLYTFGYQGRRFADLPALLVTCRVQCVVDVRRSPNSRRPEWRRGSLERQPGGRYLRLGAPGNIEKGNGCVRLVDEERGLAELAEVLDACPPG